MLSFVRRVLAALNKMATSPDVKVSGNSRISNRVSVGSVMPPYANDTFTLSFICIRRPSTEGPLMQQNQNSY